MQWNLFGLIQKAFVRLRTAAMNPFRRVIRRVQQLFNVNLITAKLITPINKKIRELLSVKPKSKEDYVTIGIFWISKKLIHFLIFAACAAVFIYFTWFASPVEDTVSTTNVVTTIYYDYDDMDLAEFTGRANIRAANGQVVYTGDIAQGYCTGNGKLWSQDGVLIYEGAFENNKMCGQGTLYYPSGKICYAGEFEENTFSGQGSYYYNDGTLQYEGEFQSGAFSGQGILYNEKGKMIYEGEFQSGMYHGSGISYYDTGIKRYEGEFYMGKAQGQGSEYSANGKLLFTGQFARDKIHYESLIGATLEEALSMFQETPVIYYNEGETGFLFANAGVVLEGDCLVEVRKNTESTDSGDGWFLPDSGGDTLTETAESRAQASTGTTGGTDQTGGTGGTTGDTGTAGGTTGTSDTADLPVLSGQAYSVYFYLATDEWQKEAELDKTKVLITGVSIYGDEMDLSMLSEETPTPENGETGLADCIAIDRIRMEQPTAFSSITFEQASRNKAYVQISGINRAEAVYAEVYETEGIRYKVCYEMDRPDQVMYVVLQSY